jgi:hypothetical protein
VLANAHGARDLRVGDVADETVAERELGLPFDRGLPRRPHEISAHELVQPVAHRALVRVADCRKRSRPEDLADDGRVLEQALTLGAQRVEPSRDQRLQRLRYGHVVARPLAQHLHELLRVERVTAGAIEQPLLRLGRKNGPLEQRADQPRGVVVRERRERDRRRVSRAAAPRRVQLVELRPCGAEDDERHRGRPRDEVLDELEQRRTCPLQVLDREHERPLRRHCLEEGPPRGERLVPLARGFTLGGADETRELAFDPSPLGGAREQRLDGCR